MNENRFARSNYDKLPATEVEGPIWRGWKEIGDEIARRTSREDALLVFDTYHGVYDEELTAALAAIRPEAEIIRTESLFHDEAYLRALTDPYVTDDELFGYLSPLALADYFDPGRLKEARERIRNRSGRVIVYGYGAGLVAPNADLTLYADMARWEIQRRFRAHSIHGVGVDNSQESPARQYKRGYFNDWPLLDNHKKSLYHRVDYWIDTHHPGHPLMIAAETFMQGIERTVHRPFRVVPFFDPAPWGGQWMKEVCDLDRSRVNFGWCFDCVPEENSLLLSIDGERFEMPAQNLVYLRPEELLGASNRQRFGESFPIRFDFLDTIGGGNLSLQVHPTEEYIRHTFGLRYTQDESYYLLDAEPGACVYLGVKQGIDPQRMIADLHRAQDEGVPFDAERYVNRFPAHKHDHYLIPSGTIHCSGAGAMVLEISATPNIFTFKMWDWGRLGLDGKPRPINIGHASHVINWSRDTQEILRHHCNCFVPIASGEGWREERTGLHEAEFIETRRHWFTEPVLHEARDGVQVLNLVEGEAVVVESPVNAFAPFTVHYAETFIIPASVGAYTIRPVEKGASCATIKAYIRS